MHKKNFNRWNKIKISTEGSARNRTFHEREIWFMRMGENVGYEQSGKGDKFLRPVIIYKKFSKDAFLGIPLTKSKKTGIFYSSFTFKEEKSTAVLSQVRFFDIKRLEYCMGKMSQGDFSRVKQKLIALLQ